MKNKKYHSSIAGRENEGAKGDTIIQLVYCSLTDSRLSLVAKCWRSV